MAPLSIREGEMGIPGLEGKAAPRHGLGKAFL